MKKLFLLPAILLPLFLLTMAIHLVRTGPARPTAIAAEPTAALPAVFIENAGQLDPAVRFQVRSAGRTLWLAEDAIWVTLMEPAGAAGQGANIRLSFAGANPAAELQPFNRQSTIISYLTGSDPAGWTAAVPAWGGVRYADLYPGLDLELSGSGETMAWRFVCRAADCRAALAGVRLQVDGAERLALTAAGLEIETAAGTFSLPWLTAVDRQGRPLAVAGAEPVLSGASVAYPLARPAPDRPAGPSLADRLYLPLVVEPSPLLYGTFLGGSGSDAGRGIAVDGAGQAYITGVTRSVDFPTTAGAFDTTQNNLGDVFVVKLDAAGSGLLYATFLGGGDEDLGLAIAIDGLGQAHVTGMTQSSNFPTTPGAFDRSYNGLADGFAVKLNAAGSGLLYSTFLGGSDEDRGLSIAVDAAGLAYIAGRTRSADYPTTPGAFDRTYNGGDSDGTVVKLNAAGSGLLYGTLLGGNEWDQASAIAVDAAGQAYLMGYVISTDFPTTPGAYDRGYNGGGCDTFIAKLNAAGSGLVYSTFLGGAALDIGNGIAVDGAGQAYVTGVTWSTDWPTTAGAFDTTFNGDPAASDAFVVKVNAAGSGLLYSTFVGGTGDDLGAAIDVDSGGRAYVAGVTASGNFPTTPGSIDTTHNGGSDGFVIGLNAAGSGLLYGAFLGGSGDDRAEGISVDAAGRTSITGQTASANFPTTPGAFDPTYNPGGGGGDAFVVRFEPN